LIPSDPATPDPSAGDPDGLAAPLIPDPPPGSDAPDPDDGPPDHRTSDGAPPVGGTRPGAGTFTIEGRHAPALFVIGWLASLIGLGTIVIALLSGGGGAAPVLLLGGLVLLSVGLVAGTGSQGIERRARAIGVYHGPSPVLVFVASIPTSLLAVVLIGIPLTAFGVAVDGPLARLSSVALQAVIYVGLIRLLVVDTGALSWAAMHVRRPDVAAVREFAGGAVWAVPVIVMTIPIAAVLSAIFPVTPVSPLPPTGETSGFILNLLAGAVVAPIGEEIMFRGFATTAWAADLGARRALIRGALFFAVVHVLTITGDSASQAAALAIIGFASRIPVALVLGWLFLRRGSIWVSIGLHSTFNGILLVLGEAALRGGM
jgi:membrane protease YdiL (CAAX protease family)